LFCCSQFVSLLALSPRAYDATSAAAVDYCTSASPRRLTTVRSRVRRCVARARAAADILHSWPHDRF
jgi:hypothetical protein